MQTVEVLITVKAYPNPSKGLGEAACIAGIDRSGKFVRLYPIPFRDLEDERRFSKYQWVRVDARPARSDKRPETLRPQFDTLQVISDPLPVGDWQARRDLVMPLKAPSLCHLQDDQKRSGTSLGFFRPAEILDFDWEPEPELEWTKAELAKLQQQDLFMTKERKPLEKIPFTFRYRFRCESCRAKDPHHIKVIDWELAEQFRRFRRETESLEACNAKLRENWLGRLCAEDRDTHFFMGNMQRFPGSFLVLGVFWPPRTDQIGLFR